MSERLFSLSKYFFKNYKSSDELKKRIKPLKDKIGQFVFCSAAFYNWDEQGVSDNEIKETIKEFVKTSNVFFEKRKDKLDETKNLKNDIKIENKLDKEWESVLISNDYQVWRKKLKPNNLYSYKVFGSFKDIPAKAFFSVQMDTEYRKKWDSLIVKLDILDREKKDNELIHLRKSLNDVDYLDSGNEVLQWIMKYPYPMYSREYCFIRRAIVCKKENLIILNSKSCDHPKCLDQNDSNFVRIKDYESQMVIKPHFTFDENGFDFLLTYFDDPRAYISVSAYISIANTKLPLFVENLHKAAIELNKTLKNEKNSQKSSEAA